ncbi:MAG: HAMP domain-containing histidine kinase [Ruminococcaceae bacterium]|nr:HAMP domain-containing histidine kinase [Oscillospiraceae bacterium]
MFKSVFSKYFSVIITIVAAGFLLMTGLQVTLFTRTVSNDKRELLLENSRNIAKHVEIYYARSYLESDGNVKYLLDAAHASPMLHLFSEAVDACVFVVDNSGKVLVAAETEQLSLQTSVAPLPFDSKDDSSHFAVSTMSGMFREVCYVAVTPITINNVRVGGVYMAAPATTVLEVLRSNFKVYLMSTVGALVLSFVAVYWLSYRFVRPLRQMASATRRFARGDFSARIQVKGNDEVAELADSLNHMAISLSSSEQMRRSFVANVSHELKTPMTTIAGFIDGMLDGTIPPEKHHHYMTIVSEEVKRLSRIVRSMLELSRIDSGDVHLNKVRIDLTDVVCSVLVSSEQRIEQKHLRITGMEDCARVELDGDRDLISQVMYNLLDNAIKFTDEGGEIDIRLRSTPGRAECVIRNTGAGIPPHEMPQIFERFYKSDRSRSLDKNGTGLGLYIVKSVIALHGGEVTVRSVEGEFTEFAVWLPTADAETRELTDGTVR